MVELGGGVATKISPPILGVGLGDSLGIPMPGYHLQVTDDDGRPVGPAGPAPYRIGEHTLAVLEGLLGYDKPRMDGLLTAGAIATP